MGDPLISRDDAAEVLGAVARAAGPYLDALPHLPVRDPAHAGLLEQLGGPLPEDGDGAVAAIADLLRIGTRAATHSSGPRFFHFVVGGSTPAAQAGDWVTSLLDQAAGLWLTSPFAARAEAVVLRWLKELLGLPAAWGGVLTPSATFANLTGLACARHWWAERHGVDVTADGLAGLPRMPVFSSGYVHASSRKALQLLGLGRDNVRAVARDDAGRLDPAALDRALAGSGPAVLIANAGEVNGGDFDPVDAMADLAERHGAWLHVDGAFGLYAALSPRTAHLVRGVERADSVAADGHKWLNVPYESGMAFVRDASALGRAFGTWNAAYLPEPDDEFVNYNNLGPESSRRARALPIWAALRAYGRSGHRAMVERHLDLARHLGGVVERSADFELLAPVTLFVVCFRYRPAGVPADGLDDLNRRLGEELVADGRVYAGTTVYRGVVALRPAIVNWRTTTEDVDLLVSVLREIGARLTGR
ncbi:pyridoxal phosphate-dependent decarboxylase family protein [Saccharothrix algeriensis]|uniref:Aspartate aminotransferase family protein n=1 Tax=Saccharothrix algeriensis TaxID=173560 RepID=A0A8T8HZF6_9PSEU|nr:pyridoxal-dependent decarboxylase [Saccharothrix algeriensis]MBM7809450.1 glutamate/tyrosine decarboxylase-like PLP-dependent enzyme [Saccharothrix algeriensis]QTR03787.1 aspartate aminotransferase family protein [Saccharothrix algeriensis]